MSIEQAIIAVYEARKARKSHPAGSFDKGGRWYPSAAEDADSFTSSIRSPSAAWPYSYMLAARTRKHIKALAAVSPDYVLALAAAIK